MSAFAAPVKVTFDFQGIEGEGIEGTVSVDNQTKSTKDKMVVFDLEPGKHVFSFYSEEYSKIIPCLNEKEFTVGNEDMEIDPFEFAGLKKVKFVASGDILKNVFEISYDFDLSDYEYNFDLPVFYKGSYMYLKHKNEFIDGDYVLSDDMFAYAYLFPGEYEYVMNSSDLLEENLSYNLTVNDNEELQVVNLSFSSEQWHRVVFKIVDKDGEPYTDESLVSGFFSEIKSSKGQRLLSSEFQYNNDVIYLKEGNYYFALYKDVDSFKHWKKVSVAGEDMEFIYTYSDEVKQDVSVNIVNAAANTRYVISFYNNGFVDWSEDMLELTTDNSGKANGMISLSEGVFDYTVYEPRSAYRGKIEVKEGAECVIDLNGYKEYTINLLDENGSLIETEEGNLFVIYQGNNCVSESYYPYPNSYTGLLKKGETYEVWSAAGKMGYDADLRKITIGDESHIDIKLKKAENPYIIMFSVDDDTPNFALSGRVTLDGTDYKGLFSDYLYSYIFNVAEGEYNYTIELNGYETIRGTVKVGPDTADDNIVYVEFDNVLFENTTGIQDSQVQESDFIVYPSLVDDYIYIRNENMGQSEYNVTLYSASGAVVLTERLTSDFSAIHVGNIESGFYFLVIESEAGRSVHKIMRR